jgi:tetratricopeptide (TPR) repeat protein
MGIMIRLRIAHRTVPDLWCLFLPALITVASAFAPFQSPAADIEQCTGLYLKGDYSGCADMARAAIGRGERNEGWWLWGVQAELVQGRHEQARELLEAGLARNPYGVRIRLLAHDLFRNSGDRKRAEGLLREIEQLAGRALGRYSDAADRVALGRAALLLGADPRQVLELFFDRVRKERQPPRDVFLASGELALEKNDDAVAAQSFEEGLNLFPNDPDMHFGLARSYADSNPERTQQAIDAALAINPHHLPSLLFLADHAIDSEQYDKASSVLDTVFETDPWQPDGWSYRAVLAHLEGNFSAEAEHRAKALKYAVTNPGVDHLIGRKLSQKYRFAEGAEYQRRSLLLDGDYLPAKIQLAQDLLRLGDESGWQIVQSVHSKDRYDITAYNLVTLHKNLSRFRRLEDGNIVVRMDPRESDLYGDRVLSLLDRAS